MNRQKAREKTMEDTSLESVKAGDEVVVTGFGVKAHIVIIEDVYSSFVVAGGVKYRKKDGCQMPHMSSGNAYIALPTEANKSQIVVSKQVEYLTHFPWSRLVPETLQEIAVFLHDRGFDTMPLQVQKEEIEHPSRQKVE